MDFVDDGDTDDAKPPGVVVHYAHGPPFHSMMDLGEDARAEVLRAGDVSWPERYQDPLYVETRRRVEDEMRRQFVEAGGDPLRLHPHYALWGRSARSERSSAPGRRAYLIELHRLDVERTSFTWGDSFRFDATYRRIRGSHPASGVVYRLQELAPVLRRWAGSTARPSWQELEFQLWYDPNPSDYGVVEVSGDGLGRPIGYRGP